MVAARSLILVIGRVLCLLFVVSLGPWQEEFKYRLDDSPSKARALFEDLLEQAKLKT